jgi:Holliday junction DNA helicase RuvA
MIATLRGIVAAAGADWMVVETGGVGFHVWVPRPVRETLGTPGAEVHLWTYLHVREDALVLYGFEAAEQRQFFETLLGVTGVGPRMALGLLSAVPVEQLMLAIANENTAVLAQVPGIGKKTAARLVLELKGKLDFAGLPVPIADGSPAAASVNSELQQVLVSLGYTPLEAQSAIGALPPDAPPELEERLRLALRYFGGA